MHIPVGFPSLFYVTSLSLGEMLDIGEETGTPVSEDYQDSCKFTCRMDKAPNQSANHEFTEERLEHFRQLKVKRRYRAARVSSIALRQNGTCTVDIALLAEGTADRH